MFFMSQKFYFEKKRTSVLNTKYSGIIEIFFSFCAFFIQLLMAFKIEKKNTRYHRGKNYF